MFEAVTMPSWMMTPSIVSEESLAIYLFIDLLKAYTYTSYSPVNRTGSPRGFSQGQISHKLNTMQNMHITQT